MIVPTPGTAASNLGEKDFPMLWRSARLVLLKRLAGRPEDSLQETELLNLIPPALQTAALVAVHKESRRVAKRFHASWGRRLTVDEIAQVLSQCGIPCFGGAWKAESHGFSKYLYRGECPRMPTFFLCDYWREAARGAVAGLNGEARFTRHRSLGHGDDGCLDYLYSAPDVDRRYGVVPALLRHRLDATIKRLHREGCAAQLIGFSERKLFARLTGIGVQLSSSKRAACLGLLRQALADSLRDIEIVELPPVTAPLGEASLR